MDWMSEAQRGCVGTRSVAQCASGSEKVSGQAETTIVVVVSELLTGETGEKPTDMRWAEGFTMLAPRPRGGAMETGIFKAGGTANRSGIEPRSHAKGFPLESRTKCRCPWSGERVIHSTPHREGRRSDGAAEAAVPSGESGNTTAPHQI